MASERLRVGEAPQIMIEGNGPLNARGREPGEIRLTSSGGSMLAPTEEGILAHYEGDATLRVPPDSTLFISQVNGPCRLRDISGAIQIEQVNGPLNGRELNTLLAGQINGPLTLREIDGEIGIEHAATTLSMREVTGRVFCQRADGEVTVRDVSADMRFELIEGGFGLRSTLREGQQIRLGQVNGPLKIKINGQGGARIDLPAAVEVRSELTTEPGDEGRQVVVVGDAVGYIRVEQAKGPVLINHYSDGADEFVFDASFIAEIDTMADQVDEQLKAVQMEIEAGLNHVRAHANFSTDLSERIRRRVEREMESAQRRIEAAQRATSRAARHAAGSVRVNVGHAAQQDAQGEPVSEEERLAILKMLEDGKITVDEAQKLLAALGG